MVERQLTSVTFSDIDTNNAALEIDVLDGAFEEMHSSKTRPDRLRAMPKLEHSRASFEKKRTEQKEIVAADECDGDIMTATNQSIETACRRETATTTTEYYYLRFLLLFHVLTNGSSRSCASGERLTHTGDLALQQ